MSTTRWIFKEELKSPSNLIALISYYLLAFISIYEKQGGGFSLERTFGMLLGWLFFVLITLKGALFCIRILSVFAFPISIYKLAYYILSGDNDSLMLYSFKDVILSLPGSPISFFGAILAIVAAVSSVFKILGK